MFNVVLYILMWHTFCTFALIHCARAVQLSMDSRLLWPYNTNDSSAQSLAIVSVETTWQSTFFQQWGRTDVGVGCRWRTPHGPWQLHSRIMPASSCLNSPVCYGVDTTEGYSRLGFSQSWLVSRNGSLSLQLPGSSDYTDSLHICLV